MNWGQLKGLAAKFVNRRDLDWDELAPLAADDISLQLVVQENEGAVQLPLAVAALPGLYASALPVDFARPRAVFNGKTELIATDMQGLMAIGAAKGFYAISGMMLYTGCAASTVSLVYSTREDVFAADGDTSVVLSRYSQVWLYGLVKHAAHRIQDFDAEELHEATFAARIEVANANYDFSRLTSGMAVRSPYSPIGS